MLFITTNFTPILSKSIVIEINGDCAILGKRVAHEHGYRYVRQVRRFYFSKKKIIYLLRFLMDFVKLKKIHCLKIIDDIDERLKEDLILHKFY